MIIKAFKHLKTILVHKWYVMKYCFQCRLYLQGIFHDMSKFSFTEFISSAKYFQGNKSPIEAEKEEIEYSNAWLHHKGHNKHHWEYWIDFDDNGNIVASKIPFKYMLEMFCDWLSAAIVYARQKTLNVDNEIKWWNEKRKNIVMNESSINLMDRFIIELFQDENFLKNHDLIEYLKVRYEHDTLDKVDWDNFIKIFTA